AHVEVGDDGTAVRAARTLQVAVHVHADEVAAGEHGARVKSAAAQEITGDLDLPHFTERVNGSGAVVRHRPADDGSAHRNANQFPFRVDLARVCGGAAAQIAADLHLPHVAGGVNDAGERIAAAEQ